MAYVTKGRMNVAGRLPGESQQRIEIIAANVGYENVAEFSGIFKQIFKCFTCSFAFKTVTVFH
jgi:YesN/AraC family two-component response regulator